MRNRYVQLSLLYISIQVIAFIEGYWGFLYSKSATWRWDYLIIAPATLSNVWFLLLEFFPNAWSWVYVVAVRAVRKKQLAPKSWPRRKRQIWIVLATILLLIDTCAFVAFRIEEPDVWWHVSMMLLSLPLLLLPVTPKNRHEGTSASPDAH